MREIRLERLLGLPTLLEKSMDDAVGTDIRSSYDIVRSNEKYDTIELAEQGAKKLCAEMDTEEFFDKFQH